MGAWFAAEEMCDFFEHFANFFFTELESIELVLRFYSFAGTRDVGICLSYWNVLDSGRFLKSLQFYERWNILNKKMQEFN